MSPIVARLVGSGLGAALGYAWYRIVGCSSGTCPITARWWTAVLYGAVMGGMAGFGG